MTRISTVALIFVIYMICDVNGQSSPMCYVCRGNNSNFACNRRAERCPNGMNACETSITIKGDGHVGVITKGCRRECLEKDMRVRVCRPPGCKYCCTGDLCNAGLSRPNIGVRRPTVSTGTSNTPTSVQNRQNRVNNRNGQNNININDNTVNVDDSILNNNENRRIMDDVNQNNDDNDVVTTRENSRASTNSKDELAFTVISRDVKHASDERLLLNVTSFITNKGNGISEVMNTTEFMAEIRESGDGNNNTGGRNGNIINTQANRVSQNSRPGQDVNNNELIGTSETVSRVDRDRNMPVIINNSPAETGHGINLSKEEEDELTEIEMKFGSKMKDIADIESTTLPTSSKKFTAMFTLLSSLVTEGIEGGQTLDVDRVVVNMGNIIDSNIRKTEFSVIEKGVYVFQVTSVASASGLVATPLVLLKNEDIVMRTGRVDGRFISAFPIGVGYVTLYLQPTDTIRLMTAPKGNDKAGVFSAPSEVTFSGFLVN